MWNIFVIQKNGHTIMSYFQSRIMTNGKKYEELVFYYIINNV